MPFIVGVHSSYILDRSGIEGRDEAKLMPEDFENASFPEGVVL